MEEREIVDVKPIEDTDWDRNTRCMSANTDMSSACDELGERELSVKYEDEPDKTFFTVLCGDCAGEYARKWDEAQIFGDQKT